MITSDNVIREVRNINDRDKERIIDFLKGAVYCWCKNQKNEWFALRDLMGGDNFHWQETPLIKLYDKHANSNDSVNLAGKDAGWILKKVIIEDSRRTFETKKESMTRKYRLINDTYN